MGGMEYLVSFICPTLSVSQWATVTWHDGCCWCAGTTVEPPGLAHLSRLAPALFRVDLQHFCGRIFVDAKKVNETYPCLPAHLALMGVFRQHAQTLYIEKGDTDGLTLRTDLRIGTLYLDPAWGSLGPVPNPRMPLTLRGTRLYYGRNLPELVPPPEGALAVVPSLAVPQWQARFPGAQCLRDGYEPTAPLHLMTTEELRKAPGQLWRAMPAQAVHECDPGVMVPGEGLALCSEGALEPYPLLQCWRATWSELWLDHCPIALYSLLLAVQCDRIVVLERSSRMSPHLHVEQQQAYMLGVPLGQVHSPWLGLELRSVCPPPAPLPARLAVKHHWCHLSRSWHPMYVKQSTARGKLQAGLGLSAPHKIRIMTASECARHWQTCSRKRKRNAPAAFVGTQLATLGEDTCPVCLDAPTSTMLRCGHALCLNCTQKCMQRHAKCPQCRHPLTTASCAYYITNGPPTPSLVGQIYGGKIALLWELLRAWGSGTSVLLLMQLPPPAQRRLATMLRQLGLGAVACGSTERGKILILSPSDLRGVSLPYVQHAVYLHALLEVAGEWRQLVDWALPASASVHCLRLRNTLEELLPPPTHF